jgi:hypothetical protein
MWFWLGRTQLRRKMWAKYHNGANAGVAGFVDEEGTSMVGERLYSQIILCTFLCPHARKPFNTQKIFGFS